MKNKELLFFLKRDKNLCSSLLNTKELQHGKMQGCYSPDMILPKRLAPMVTHKRAFLLIFSTNTKRSVCLLGNVQALRSFLISQEISNGREEAMALRFGITPFVIILHQLLIVRPVH
jgi:hypothetical protein